MGVARQLEDCRKLAADRGWPVGAEYVDNDVSAFSGKPRRQYARMLADLASGDRDAVIVYNLDRLHRRRGDRIFVPSPEFPVASFPHVSGIMASALVGL